MSEPFTSEQKKIDAPAEGLSAKGLYNAGYASMRFVQTVAVGVVLASSPAHALTSKDKTGITVSIGCGSGLVGGVIADSQNNSGRKNSLATIGTSTAIGCIAGLGWSFFFQEDNEQKMADEFSKFRDMSRGQGKMLLDKDTLISNAPDRVNCTGDQRYGVLWPGKDGTPSTDGEVHFAYLSPNVAVQYVAFYSFDGCFAGPYVKAPSLNLYMNEIFKRQENSK